jgi:hypothetical protein
MPCRGAHSPRPCVVPVGAGAQPAHRWPSLTRIADALEPIGFSVFPVPWVSKEGASHVCWECMRVQARMLWMRVPRRGTRRPTSPRSCAAKAGPQRVRVRCAQNDVCAEPIRGGIIGPTEPLINCDRSLVIPIGRASLGSARVQPWLCRITAFEKSLNRCADLNIAEPRSDLNIA